MTMIYNAQTLTASQPPVVSTHSHASLHLLGVKHKGLYLPYCRMVRKFSELLRLAMVYTSALLYALF